MTGTKAAHASSLARFAKIFSSTAFAHPAALNRRGDPDHPRTPPGLLPRFLPLRRSIFRDDRLAARRVKNARTRLYMWSIQQGVLNSRCSQRTCARGGRSLRCFPPPARLTRLEGKTQTVVYGITGHSSNVMFLILIQSLGVCAGMRGLRDPCAGLYMGPVTRSVRPGLDAYRYLSNVLFGLLAEVDLLGS